MEGAYPTLTRTQEAPMKPIDPLKTKRRIRMEANTAVAPKSVASVTKNPEVVKAPKPITDKGA